MFNLKLQLKGELIERLNLKTHKIMLVDEVKKIFSGVSYIHIADSYINLFLEDAYVQEQLTAVMNFINSLSSIRDMLSFSMKDSISVMNNPDYYALAQDYAYEDTYPYRVGYYFELVPCELLDAMLSKQQIALDNIRGSEIYKRVLYAFIEGGMNGKEFQEIKSEYLGYLEHPHIILTSKSTSFTGIELGRWYRYRNLSQGAWSSSAFDVFYEDEDSQRWVLEGNSELEMLSEETDEKLRELFSITTPEETQNLGDIYSGTTFSKVTIFDVGQGLCAGIFDSTRSIQAFFDLGCPYSVNHAHVCIPLVGNAPDFATIIGLLRNLRGRRVSVILSHWHADHYALAYALVGELGQTIWRVPADGYGVTAQAIYQLVLNDGGLMYSTWGSSPCVNYNHNPHMLLGKIMLTNHPPNPHPHPHNNGFYAMLELQSNATVFLSGDTTYQGIPAAERSNWGNGFCYLQAAHHGGNYHPAPASSATAIRRACIPTVDGTGIQTVIYSAGPRTRYRHPSSQSVTDYATVGWVTQHNTHTLSTFICG